MDGSQAYSAAATENLIVALTSLCRRAVASYSPTVLMGSTLICLRSTVMPLAQEGWSSVHTVIDESRFWEIISRLKELGAQGILVVPVEKMIL